MPPSRQAVGNHATARPRDAREHPSQREPDWMSAWMDNASPS